MQCGAEAAPSEILSAQCGISNFFNYREEGNINKRIEFIVLVNTLKGYSFVLVRYFPIYLETSKVNLPWEDYFQVHKIGTVRINQKRLELSSTENKNRNINLKFFVHVYKNIQIHRNKSGEKPNSKNESALSLFTVILTIETVLFRCGPSIRHLPIWTAITGISSFFAPSSLRTFFTFVIICHVFSSHAWFCGMEMK